MEYKTVSLIIGSYTVPNKPDAITLAEERLFCDLSAAVRHWDIDQYLVETVNTDEDARHDVPDWLLEDLEDGDDDGWPIEMGVTKQGGA